jgi:hypothetical protein
VILQVWNDSVQELEIEMSSVDIRQFYPSG